MSTKRIKDSVLPGEHTARARIFTPVEHAALAQFLNKPDLLPEWARHIDLSEFPKKDWNEATDGIAPTKSIQHSHTLGNVAARIALATIQHRLPQWGAFTPGHGVTFSRTLRLFPVRKVNSQPLFLFSINWADSGPGFSWPESYHVTWIPYYDKFLVTASSDSKDLFGFEDLSLGSFTGSSKRGTDLEKIRARILGFWQEHRDYEFEAWESVSKTGAIKESTALAWRSRVWRKSDASIEEY